MEGINAENFQQVDILIKQGLSQAIKNIHDI